MGEGTNDAPAIKKADVGIGLGISGTEICREASDLLLLDDNIISFMRARKISKSIYGYLNWVIEHNLV